MDNSSLVKRLGEIATKATKKNDLELVHVEVVGSKKNPILRVFIDKAEGITHNDCAEVSSEVEQILDSEDFISSSYLLEVSSPGIERKLYSLKDFERFIGSTAKVKTDVAINGQRNFLGEIIEVKDEEIIFEDKTNGRVQFPFSSVKKARLKVDFEEDFKRANRQKS